MHRLTESDLAVQATARAFADELIPFEVEAELHDGRLAPDVEAAHRGRAATWASRRRTSRSRTAGAG